MAQKMQTYDETRLLKSHPWVPKEPQDYVLRSPNVERKNWINIIISLLCCSLTLVCSFKHSLQLALQKWELAGRICDFGIFFNGLKSPRVLRLSWILNECNLYCKIVKYCILSEVCIMKTVPRGANSPQMWYINGIKGWFTRTRSCWQNFVK